MTYQGDGFGNLSGKEVDFLIATDLRIVTVSDVDGKRVGIIFIVNGELAVFPASIEQAIDIKNSIANAISFLRRG